jgi:hypothetical protein
LKNGMPKSIDSFLEKHHALRRSTARMFLNRYFVRAFPDHAPPFFKTIGILAKMAFLFKHFCKLKKPDDSSFSL